jgi:hypothetical protein
MNNILLRPNIVSVDRRSGNTPSVTGARSPVVANINAGIPALIDPFRQGSEEYTIAGVQYNQDQEMFVDGLEPYQFAGIGPGGTVVVNGVTYTVSANGQGAYPDIRRGDRITDETGQEYLVLAVAVYYTTFPTVECKLASGMAWGS